MDKKKRAHAHIIALEPRMMFDGAGVATAVAVDAGVSSFSAVDFTYDNVLVAPIALDSRADGRSDASRVSPLALAPQLPPGAGSDYRSSPVSDIAVLPTRDDAQDGTRAEISGDDRALAFERFDRILLDGEVEAFRTDGFEAEMFRSVDPLGIAGFDWLHGRTDAETYRSPLEASSLALALSDIQPLDGAARGLDIVGFDREAVDFDPTEPALLESGSEAGNEFIFIDTDVENYQELVETWEGRGTIILIDGESDGVEQILTALAGETNIGAIHIVSHGEEGLFWLGGTLVDNDALTGELAQAFAAIGSKLAIDGDILIYGCEVGKDGAGQELLDNLAAITGADIAASIDDTGTILRGGDWTLESRLGVVEAETLTAENWYGLLMPTTISAPDDSLTVRDQNGNILAQGSTGFTAFGRFSPTVPAGGTATWDNVGTLNGQSISLRATVVSISTSDSIRFERPGVLSDDPTFAMFAGGSTAENAQIEIRWEVFFTATGAPAEIDVNFTVADIDGSGNVPRSREFVTVDTDTLSSFQAANGSNVLFDTSIPGEVTASGTQNEGGGVPSAAQFSWLETSSWTITYNLVPTASSNAVFSHDGDADFNLGTGGTTVSIPRLDLDNNDSTTGGSGYLGSFVENGPAVSIVDNDVRVENPDGNVEGATITLTNAQTGDELLVNGSTAASGTLGGGISYTRTATEIILTGAANAAQYQNALRAITFQSLGERPSEVDRTIEIGFENASLSSNIAISTMQVTEVNDPPTAINDTQQTTNEDTPITNIDVLSNDSDGDGDSLTVISASANNGTVTINPDGSLNYTPNTNFNGNDTITYTISDGRGGTSTATVPIVVNAVNDEPTTVGSLPSQSNQDAQAGIFVDVSGGFTDVEDSNLTFSASNLPAGLSIDPGTGFITGTIDNSASQGGAGGVYTVTITATDSGGLSTTQDFTWTVTNPPPQANDDGGSGVEDTPITVNVIGNDFDPDGDTINVISASATNGTVVINPDNTLTYTPNPNFNGPDVITYTISDGEGGTDMAVFNIFVNAQNDPPTTVGSLPPQTNLDADSGISVATAGAFNDIDGPSAIYSATGLPPGLSINSATGEITGTIDNSASQGGSGGVYSVAVTLSDGAGGSATQNFSWTVTNPPPMAANDTASTTEDTPVNIDVLANDNDPDGDTINVVSASAANGTVVIEADGTLTYTPNADFNGSDTITYQISDGEGGTSTAQVAVTVTPDNDPPTTVGSLPAQNNQDADSGISVATSGGFADVDDASLTYSATGLPPGLSINMMTGEITGTIDNSASQGGTGGVYNVVVTATDAGGLMAMQGFTWTVTNPPPMAANDTASTNEDIAVNVDVLANDNDPDGDTISVIAASAANGTVVIEADGTLTYTPDANFNGSDTITYTISDGEGGTSMATVAVTVNAVNDDPVSTPIPSENVLDGEVVSVSVAGSFSDPENDTLTYGATGLPPGLSIDPASGLITGTITSDASQGGVGGVYTATITVDDGNGGSTTETITFNVTNPGPQAVNDAASTDEDTPVNIDVLANDSDPDGDPLTVTSASALNGTVVIEPDGTVTYTPNPGFNGNDTITYQISDGNGGFSVASVTVTVTEVNDPPTPSGSIGNQTHLDGQTISLPVAGAFSDPDGDTLTFSATGLPAGLTIDPMSGLISGTIDNSASQGGMGGVYSVVVTADDGRGGTTTQGFTWRVDNPAPIASNDSTTTDEDTPVNVNVLANDADPDGDTLTVIAATAGNGTVAINADGSLLYTPNPDFNGTDTIVYRISDGEGGESTASVDVVVNPVNDAPTTVGLPNQDGEDGETVSIPTATAFNDVDGDTLTFSATGLPPSLSIDPMTGLITGTLASDSSQNGPFIVTVTATDPSGESVDATFVYAVQNIPPVAVDDTATTAEDTPVTVAVLTNDSDPDGDPLTITSASADNGTVVVNADGTLTFTPNANFNGEANVTYQISDGQGGVATATLTVTVTPVNDDPTAISIPNVTNEDGQSVSVATDSFFSDVDGDALTITATGLPPGLSINPATGIVSGTLDSDASQGGAGGVYLVTLTADDGNGGTISQSFNWTVTNPAPTAFNDSATTDEDTSVNIDVLPNDVDPDGDTLTVISASAPNGTVVIEADGTLTYTPDPDFNGSDTITYTVSDGQGGTSTAAVDVTVNPVNDDPVAVDDTATTNEDTPVIIGVLGNDSDIDGDTLTVTSATSPDGTVVINPDGTITFTPAPNFNGPTTITYSISDGNGGTATATVNVTVDPVNDPPVANPDSATTDEDTPVNIPLIGNDTDIESDPLTVVSASAPNGTVVINPDGSVDYTPNPDFNGTDTITYQISDGNGGFATSTVTVTVNPVNDDPVVATPIAAQTDDDADPIALDVSGSFSDVDGDALTFSATGLPPGLSIDAAGNITGTLAADASQGGPLGDGVYTVEVTADDGNGGTVTNTFSWTVTNPPPVAANDSATTDEEVPVNIDVLANDSDPDGDTISVTSATAPNGTVVIEADGTITYTPGLDFNGTDTITYEISDGEGGTTTATVTVTVNPTNDDPVASPIPAQSNVDSQAIALDVSGSFSDVDGDALTFSATGLPPGLSIDAAGNITGMITADASQGGPLGDGVYSVEVTADDGNGGTVSTTFTWTVANPIPDAINDTATTDEDTPVNIDVLANDSDPDGDPLTVTSAAAANGTVVIEADGTITYTPAQDFNGTDTITYQISDGNGGVDTATVTVTVNPVNDDPEVDTPLPNLADVDSATVNVPVAGNFSDLDGDSLTFSATGLPTGLSIDAAGNITGTIDPSASQGGPMGDGIYQVTVTADDGNGGRVSTSFAWTITNPPPTAANDTATTDEDTPVNIDVLANDNDPDGDALSVVSATALNGSVVIEADGTITYTPDQDFNGTDTITYQISDGEGGTSTATVAVTVNPVNDDPTVSAQILNQDNSDADVVALDVSGNFDDLDGDTLTFSATGLPAGLSIDAAGNITGTVDPSASQGGPASNGVYQVTVTADDGNGGTVSSTFFWTIDNPAPTAANDTASTVEDNPVNIDVLANDSDPDGDALTVISASANNGSVFINPDGTLTYTPDANFNGTDTITYQISDGEGGTSTASVTVTVSAVNDAPETAGLPDLTDGNNETINVPLGAAFSDPEGDTITYNITGLPDGLTFDPGTGTVSGTTTATASTGGPGGDGIYTVTVTADDGNGGVTSTSFTWTINNQPPTAVNDSFTGVEDTPQILDVLANDVDPDGDPMTPIVVTGATATNGTALVNPDGTILFTPDPNFNGVATVTYTIEDANGDPATAVATITIAAVNDAPEATPLPDQSDRDGDAITIDASTLFTDVEGDTLTYSVSNLPAGLSINPTTGLITGTIDSSASQFNGGVYSSVITADDGNGGVTDVMFVWTVTNPGPTAVDDTASTTEDTASAPIDVLANDNDPDNDTLTVISANAPNGTVVINPDNTLTYTPDPNFNGTDTITYQISDGEGGTSTAIVTVTVTADNDDPTAQPLPARGSLDADVVNLDLSGGFDDLDGDTLTFSATGLPTGLSIDANGVVTGTIDPSASQGGPGSDGVYSVTITADDGNGGTVSTGFTWTVTNPAPTAVNDTASTNEDTPVNIDVLANDNDPDGDALTVTLASAANGTVVIEADGTLTYTPDADFNGTDTITYEISDGEGGTSTATVTVTVNPQNDDPTATPLPPRDNVDGASVNVSVASSFDDVEGDTLTFSATGLPPGLSIDAAGNITGTIDPAASQGGPLSDGVYSVTITADDGNGGSVSTTFDWTVTNPVPIAADDTATTDEDTTVNIDVLANDNDPDGDPLTVVTATAGNGSVTIQPDGTIDYTPDPDFNGTDTILYTISDGNGGTASASVTVTVNPVNDDPVAVDDTATTDEDTPVTISPLANDSDVDGDPLTITSAAAPNGSVSINPNGTVTYTPDPDFNGTDTITYEISDGNGGTDTATITVVVSPVNDDPVAVPDTVTTPEDTPITIPVLANDTDVDGDPLSVTTATSPDGTVTINPDGTVTFTPNPDANGPATITYTISDGNGGTATTTVTVNVTPVNDPPVALDDTATTPEDTPVTVAVLTNDSDVDGDTLTVTDATAANGTVTINPDGTLTYTPDPDFNGTDTVTYTIDDGNGGTDTATLTITVDPVNDAPVANDDTVAVDEDQPITIPVLANDTDADGDPLTVTSASSPNGTVTINPDGTVTFVPDPNFNGPTTITYAIDDGMGGTATATVAVNVNPVNDPPVGQPDTATTDEDTPVTIPVLANDTDIDGDPLTVVSASAPNGTVTINPDGTITYTPDPNFNGTDTITYQVSDGMGGFDTVTATVTVNPVNDAPIAGPDVATVDEDSEVTIPILANDSDPDGDPITVTSASAPNGTVTINPDGTVTYTPNPDFNGTDTITYTIDDGNGGVTTGTVTVTVSNVNDFPTDEPETVDGFSGSPTIIDVLDNASDPDGDPLSVIIASVDVGEVVINPDGTLTYTSPDGFTGIATIRYTISDGNGGFVNSTATVNISAAGADLTALLGENRNPGLPDAYLVDEVRDQSEEFITTPLIIVDTANGFRPLGGTGTLNVDQPLLEAVNGIRSLNGIGDFDRSRHPIEGVVDYIDHIRDLRFGVDRLLDPRFGDFIPEALTGFSVRQLDTGNDQVMIESIVRDRVVYVEMRDIGGGSGSPIAEFQLLTRDGSPLPDWIRIDPRGLAIIERPADAEELRLIVRAITEDGETIDIPVRIQGATGEIQTDVPHDKSLVRAETLGAMMARESSGTSDEVDDLLAAFV